MASTPLTLQDAIQWVDAEARAPETLLRLRTASALVQGLTDVGDAVLGYYVDQARHEGHSWSEIGDALGVSKQAVQRRHTSRVSLGPNAPTLEHLTPRARNVLEAAQETARDRGDGYVGTEHLLLALYREPNGVGALVLVDAGLSQAKAESAVAERAPRRERRRSGEPAFTPRALAALSGALSSALGMGHGYIGTEHLLLGLAQGDGVAAAVLRDGGLTHEVIVQRVHEELARLAGNRTPTRKPTQTGKRRRR